MRLIGLLCAGAAAILLWHGCISLACPSVQGVPGQVLAQAEPTAVNGYPGPTETVPVSTVEPYPGAQPSPPPVASVTPYPAGAAAPEGSPPVPIIGQGEESATAPDTARSDQQPPTRQVASGRLFLWGGFIVALLLFATSVAGSIVLFSRRRG